MFAYMRVSIVVISNRRLKFHRLHVPHSCQEIFAHRVLVFSRIRRWIERLNFLDDSLYGRLFLTRGQVGRYARLLPVFALAHISIVLLFNLHRRVQPEVDYGRYAELLNAVLWYQLLIVLV